VSRTAQPTSIESSFVERKNRGESKNWLKTAVGFADTISDRLPGPGKSIFLAVSQTHWTVTLTFVGGFGLLVVEPALNWNAPASHAPLVGLVT